MFELIDWTPGSLAGAVLITLASFSLTRTKYLGPYRWGAAIALAGGCLGLGTFIAGAVLPASIIPWLHKAAILLPYAGIAILLGRSREDRYPLVAILALASIPWYFFPLAKTTEETAGSNSGIGMCLLGLAFARLAWVKRTRRRVTPQ